MRHFINLMESFDPAAILIAKMEASPVPGIELHLIHENSETVGIGWIKRHDDAAPGRGAEVIQTMCDLADELCVWLVLGVEIKDDEDDEDEPPEDAGYDAEVLLDYYSKFGFEETGTDGEFQNMSRDPEGG